MHTFTIKEIMTDIEERYGLTVYCENDLSCGILIYYNENDILAIPPYYKDKINRRQFTEETLLELFDELDRVLPYKD